MAKVLIAASILLVANISQAIVKEIAIKEVHDGDTVLIYIPGYPSVFSDMAVRIKGIDTPELRGETPCEKERAIEARDFLSSLISKAKMVEIEHVERDKYFRLLADIYADGVSVADELIKKKLAVPYFGEKKLPHNWCQK
jgi:endonuclease YncB( thermonuclease family)